MSALQLTHEKQMREESEMRIKKTLMETLHGLVFNKNQNYIFTSTKEIGCARFIMLLTEILYNSESDSLIERFGRRFITFKNGSEIRTVCGTADNLRGRKLDVLINDQDFPMYIPPYLYHSIVQPLNPQTSAECL